MAEEVDFKRMLIYCAIVGALIGLISSIPILRLPNICCLWIIAGGFAAAYLTMRDVKSVEMVDGAIIGAVFGIVYAIIEHVVMSALNMVFDIIGLGLAVRGVSVGGFASILDVSLRGILWWILLFVLNMIEGIIFGAVGGLIYTGFFSSGERTPEAPAWSAPAHGKTTLSKR